MIARAVLLLSFAFVAAADARETATLRIGSHDGFIRVVIESQTPRSFAGSILPDARQSIIETAAELSLTRPGRIVAPISAIAEAVGESQGTRITLTFDSPMSLLREMTFPSLKEKGYRHVFDFAPAKEGATSIHGDVASPSPSAPQPLDKSGQFLSVILQTAQLGLSDLEIRQAIATKFGLAQPLIRMSFKSPEGETGFLLTHRVSFEEIGSVQVVYKFSSRSERLDEVDIDWGAAGDAPLSDENAHRIVTSLSQGLRASGFAVVGPKNGADTSDDATILFTDGKPAGHRAMLSWVPQARRLSGSAGPAIRLSLVGRYGQQTGSMSP